MEDEGDRDSGEWTGEDWALVGNRIDNKEFANQMIMSAGSIKAGNTSRELKNSSCNSPAWAH